MKNTLIERGLLTDHEFQKMQGEVTEAMDAAAKFAIESPYPDPKETYTDVFTEAT